MSEGSTPFSGTILEEYIMPTGYTSEIANDQTFEDYLLGCARAFGACIHQRDDAMRDKPKLRTVSNWYEESILELEAELGAIKTMNRQQREEYGQELKEEYIKYAQEAFNEKVLLKNKYDAMLQKVLAWNPPTPDHVNLKQFMIDQINDSIKFDCDTNYTLEQLTKATNADPLKLVDEKAAGYEESIRYYEEQAIKDQERVDNANRWISALYDSLGIEYEYVAD